MSRILTIALVSVLAACAARSQTQFSTSGTGVVDTAMDCVVDAIDDEIFDISGDLENGLLDATHGPDTLQVRISGAANNTYGIQITTSDTEPARDVAREIVLECGT